MVELNERGFTRGVYCGDDSRLRRKTALLQPCILDDAYCAAQFDDTSLSESIGWHGFKKTDFNPIENFVATRVESKHCMTYIYTADCRAFAMSDEDAERLAREITEAIEEI